MSPVTPPTIQSSSGDMSLVHTFLRCVRLLESSTAWSWLLSNLLYSSCSPCSFSSASSSTPSADLAVCRRCCSRASWVCSRPAWMDRATLLGSSSCESCRSGAWDSDASVCSGSRPSPSGTASAISLCRSRERMKRSRSSLCARCTSAWNSERVRRSFPGHRFLSSRAKK